MTEPGVNSLLPFVSQAGKDGKAVARGLQRQMHVLQRQRQRELSRVVTAADTRQLGRLPWREPAGAGRCCGPDPAT